MNSDRATVVNTGDRSSNLLGAIVAVVAMLVLVTALVLAFGSEAEENGDGGITVPTTVGQQDGS